MNANNKEARSVGAQPRTRGTPRSLRLAAATLALSLLGACGQKGPLVHPKPGAPSAGSAASSPTRP